ncbi:MAG: YigZ family protein [Pleurocapsa minor GSE-CHR-MK-17-07R]|jgi:uncharacterized YigZ family protein|nr:YigZ family protein [Pleurocapsa minor GSE-CHR-MK 17-07R]
MSEPYKVPAATSTIEIERNKSRFIGTAGRARTTAEAKLFLNGVRQAYPDATHHAYAFRAGYGNSVQEGLSDDGEPSGTAGPPIMNYVRGANLGDLVVVVTRYYGGINLGTGGLVRAYGDAAREVIATLPVEEKVSRVAFTLIVPYAQHARVKQLLSQHDGRIDDEQFAGSVTLRIILLASRMADFTTLLRDASSGTLIPQDIMTIEP